MQLFTRLVFPAADNWTRFRFVQDTVAECECFWPDERAVD